MGEKKRKVDKEEAAVVARNIRNLLQSVGKTEDDLKKSHHSPTYISHILLGHTNIGKKTVADIVGIFHQWGHNCVKPDMINLHDPALIEVLEHLLPVFDVMAGKLVEFTDKGYPVGHSDKYEYADTRDPNAFWVLVHEDSMIGAGGIPPGSRALVEPNAQVENGNIVFVRHRGEVTIKKIIRQDRMIVLQAMNPSYDPIVIDDPEELKTVRIYRVTQINIRV